MAWHAGLAHCVLWLPRDQILINVMLEEFFLIFHLVRLSSLARQGTLQVYCAPYVGSLTAK